jgi:hypothetical protein
LIFRVAFVFAVLLALSTFPFAWGVLSGTIRAVRDPLSAAIACLATLWIASPIAAALAAARSRRFSFWLLYISLCTGLVFGSSVLPLANRLIPDAMRAEFYVAANGATAFAVATLHFLANRRPTRQ